ncbi:MAG TPA: NAD(P)-dependent oxidoreductase [Noviherbaspirillum sp.]|nr:NAD(P)-dependent oxidoreductase [Noviherbaspirillum sp.]
MDSQRIPRIAFLGTGLMGMPMAKRLLAAGYPISAWNRTRAKAEAVGASTTDTSAQAVAGADVVITMLQDGTAVRSVIGDALPALQRGAVVVDMSSTAHAEALELHGLLDAREIGFMDAPVSGGVLGAEQGTLAIMVGGSPENFARVEAVLNCLGRPTLVGPPGSGQIAKLCNQLIVGGTLALVAEALLLAQAGGADPAAVRAAIRGGFAESRILEVHGARMLARNFMPGGQVKSQAKDMENVLAAAHDTGLQLPLAEIVAGQFCDLLPHFPAADQAAALLALERINPGWRLGTTEDRLP